MELASQAGFFAPFRWALGWPANSQLAENVKPFVEMTASFLGFN